MEPMPEPVPAPETSPAGGLLQAMRAGDEHASDELLRTLFHELRRMARARLMKLPPGQTLQPTALVHEAWLRLIGREVEGWRGREDFLFLAARAMHDVLVEEARKKASLRRGGDHRRDREFDLRLATETPPEDLLALDEVLERLARADPRKAELVRLRFFVGLSVEEVAEVLDVSVRTISREWRFVRTWLFQELRSLDVDP